MLTPISEDGLKDFDIKWSYQSNIWGVVGFFFIYKLEDSATKIF